MAVNGRRQSFVTARFGPTTGEERRSCEGEVARALAERSIGFDGFALNGGGCCFVLPTADEPGSIDALRSLNARSACEARALRSA